MKATIISFILAMVFTPKAIGEEQVQNTVQNSKQFRTFIAIQRYNMESNGDEKNPVSQTKMEIVFPNNATVKLPENGGYWTIGNGQTQEINRTFEVPFSYVQQDGFKFTIQLYRKGSKMMPCSFDVAKLSEYNRAYVCHTDLNYQASKNISQDKLDREGVQIRIFTDLNTPPKDMPQEALALK